MNTALSAPARRAGEHVLPLALAPLSIVAAGIHAWVTPEHFEEYVLFGAFFAVVTVFQVAWAAAIVLRPTRRVVVAGTVVSAAIVLIWALSRTAGLPVGPHPWIAEDAGALDMLAAMAEVGIVALGLRLTAPSRSH